MERFLKSNRQEPGMQISIVAAHRNMLLFLKRKWVSPSFLSPFTPRSHPHPPTTVMHEMSTPPPTPTPPPRAPALKVWTQTRIWGGFLRCAKMMAKESGATSFIALVQLPGARLKEALDNPLLKVCLFVCLDTTIAIEICYR